MNRVLLQCTGRSEVGIELRVLLQVKQGSGLVTVATQLVHSRTGGLPCKAACQRTFGVGAKGLVESIWTCCESGASLWYMRLEQVMRPSAK